MSSADGNQRTALIVGASRGLGLALTEELWSRGWQVIATRRDGAPKLQTLADRSDGGIEMQWIANLGKTELRFVDRFNQQIA